MLMRHSYYDIMHLRLLKCIEKHWNPLLSYGIKELKMYFVIMMVCASDVFQQYVSNISRWPVWMGLFTCFLLD